MKNFTSKILTFLNFLLILHLEFFINFIFHTENYLLLLHFHTENYLLILPFHNENYLLILPLKILSSKIHLKFKHPETA